MLLFTSLFIPLILLLGFSRGNSPVHNHTRGFQQRAQRLEILGRVIAVLLSFCLQ